MLKGIPTSAPPEDYVENQREYNVPSPPFEARTLALALRLFRTMTIPPESFLDVGFRTPNVMETCKAAFPACKVSGVDIVPEFVERALVEDADRGFFEVIQEADIHTLPFEDASFDWVFCVECLEHAYDIERALTELFRVAKRGLFISVPLETEESFTNNPSHYFWSQSTRDWLALFLRIHTHWDVSMAITVGPHLVLTFLNPDAPAPEGPVKDTQLLDRAERGTAP